MNQAMELAGVLAGESWTLLPMLLRAWIFAAPQAETRGQNRSRRDANAAYKPPTRGAT
jgi:hypothetical protein